MADLKHNNGFRERIQFGAAASNKFHKIELEVGYSLVALVCILAGSLVVSGGTANGTALGENPALIGAQQFEIDATPSASNIPGGKIKSVTSRTVLRRRIIDQGIYQ